jgi:hypothetical protein
MPEFRKLGLVFLTYLSAGCARLKINFSKVGSGHYLGFMIVAQKFLSKLLKYFNESY